MVKDLLAQSTYSCGALSAPATVLHTSSTEAEKSQGADATLGNLPLQWARDSGMMQGVGVHPGHPRDLASHGRVGMYLEAQGPGTSNLEPLLPMPLPAQTLCQHCLISLPSSREQWERLQVTLSCGFKYLMLRLK